MAGAIAIAVTGEQLLRAEQYWEEQKYRVKVLAKKLGYKDYKPSSEVLLKVFDNGEAKLTDKQVLERLAEVLN